VAHIVYAKKKWCLYACYLPDCFLSLLSNNGNLDYNFMAALSAQSGRIVLEKTAREFEGQAVLNPGCIEVDGTIHMFYRAVRTGNHSSVGYCQIQNGEVSFRAEVPVLEPEFEWECHGIEDPRISCIDGVYYLVYIAYDGLNARIAYATADELPHFTKRGVISPPMPYHEVAELCKGQDHHSVFDFFNRYYKPEFAARPELENMLVYEKDAFLFPRKIGGRFALVHRVFPEVQVIYFERFEQLQTVEYWAENLYDLQTHTILRPEFWFESRHIGGGAVPLETEAGWLFLYHAVQEDTFGQRTYHAAAALLDLDDPTVVLGRLNYPLFSPGAEFEKVGDVENVVFPTGAVVDGDTLRVYYGAADTVIAERTFSLSGLLAELGYQPEEECLPEGELVFSF
jgi:predicted GH43/DUF377 family glycosyl hydrolase